ncbi:hypothetical protein DFH07DRAFT_806828 [Mycena maculata]|uniref:Aminoglycoside phosphotransferase domain-containing protein n=1 Tax=Mycena maculata TaxID=230809 RepID=A0AAD7JS66_9AGAR|nr:hypothetical protein DFH07DRAFT_806828 [Mycena maculata]
MGGIPSVLLPFRIEDRELIYPSPNVERIVQHVDDFFVAENLRCQRSQMLSLGGYHAIIEITVGRRDDVSVHSSVDENLPIQPGQRRLIARVDFPFQVCSTNKAIGVPWKLPSEVATMRYLKANTSIPIPNIYFYDEDSDGEVGGPWMLMEYVEGEALPYSWETMNREQKHSICQSIAEYWNQLLSLRFDALGSLCIDQSGEITVGPLSMMCSISAGAYDHPSRQKCGPFETPREWILAMAKGDFRYKTRMRMVRGSKDPIAEAKARQTQRLSRMETNVTLLSKLPLLYKDSPIHPIALCPVDFRMHNVIVSTEDPTIIVGVIDWEGTQTAPIWNIRRDSFFNLVEPKEQAEMDAVIWEKVSNLNAEWADAMASGGSLRDAALRADLSDWEPERYTWEIPDSG